MGAFWDAINDEYEAPYIEGKTAPDEPPSLWERFLSNFSGGQDTPTMPYDPSQYMYDPAYTQQANNGLLNNAGQDITDWAGVVGEDVDRWKQAKTNEEFLNGVWDIYSDAIARPAGLAAVTPFLPAQARIVAGAAYLPKFLSDVAETYSSNVSAGDAGEATGEGGNALPPSIIDPQAAGQTVWQTVVDPLVNLGSRLYNDPAGLANDIYEHPVKAWDEVLGPVSVVEAPARIGKAAFDKNLTKPLDDAAENFIRAPEETMGGRYAEDVLTNDRIMQAVERADAARGNTEPRDIQQYIDDSMEQNLGAYVDDAGYYYGDGASGEYGGAEAPSTGNRFMDIARETADLIRAKYPDASPQLEQYLYGQMMHESAWGKDPAALEYNNFAGLHGGAKGRHYANDHEYAQDYASFFTDGLHGDAVYATSPHDFAQRLSNSGWFEDTNVQGYGDTIESALADYDGMPERAGGYTDAPLTEKYYTVLDEVSDTGITDLTEQKLNLIARDYRERYGDDLQLTSMKRNGDGTSWHDSGQAFDLWTERLANDPEARAWLVEQGKRYGLYGLDEWEHPSAHATGGHIHFSDHGEPLAEGATRGNAGRSPVPNRSAATRDYSESIPQTGEMTDAFGRDFSEGREFTENDSAARVQQAAQQLEQYIGKLRNEQEQLQNAGDMPVAERMRRLETTERQIQQAEATHSQMMEAISGGMNRLGRGEEAGFPQRRSNTAPVTPAHDPLIDGMVQRTRAAQQADINGIRQYRDNLIAQRDKMIADEVQRYQDNPGGKGVNQGYLWDSYDPVTGRGEGQITGRYAESNNTQWYQDFYRQNGRKPNKSEYAQIAEENLKQQQDYAELDREIRRTDEMLRRMEENPYDNPADVWDSVEDDIRYERAGNTPGSRKSVKKDSPVKEDVESLFDETAESEGLPQVNPPKAREPYEGETIKNKDYFDRIRQLFGTLRLGRTPKDAKGIYDRRQDVARANHNGNYDTVWHEIGHRLDDKMGLSDIAERHADEMAAAMERKYPDGIPYEEAEYAGEGVAEFIKDYVQDPEGAKKNYPGFAREFEERLAKDKDMAARIKEAQDMSKAYREQPTGAKIAAHIDKKEPKTFKEKAKEFVHNFMENWVDDKHGIKRAEKEVEKIIGRKLTAEESAYVYSRIAKDRGVSAATQLLTGKDPQAVKDALNKIYGGCVKNAVTLPQIMDGLKALAETEKGKEWIKAEGLTDVNEALSVYTIARRFMEVYDLKYAKPLKELQETAAKAQEALSKAEEKEAAAKERLKAIKGYNGRAEAQRDFEAAHKAAVEARAEARKAANEAKKKEETGYRMPVKYEECKEFVENAPEEMKKAAQGVYDLNENIIDILHHEGIISDEVHKSLKENHKHYVSLAREFPDDAAIRKDSFMPSNSFINVGSPLKKLSETGSYLDVKDPMQQMAKNIFNALSLVERNKVGVKLTSLSNLKGVGGIVEKVEGDARQTDSSFYVWKNGKKEVYNTTPEIYQSLKSLKPEGVDSMMRYLAELPARYMRAGAVVYNPAFVLKNLSRDQLTAYLFSEYGYKPFYDMAKGIYHMLKEDELYQEFKTSGVIMSTVVNAAKDYSGDVLREAQRTKAEKVFHALNPLANLERLSNFIESGTRMGLYAKARGKGASMIEATMEAREGTLDFGKAGKSGRAANKYLPFFNAAVQDPALFYQKFKQNPARMLKRLAPMVMGSMAICALIRSNDDLSHEYDQLMPYEKNMFWNIPVPKSVCETGWIRYPKPFGPGFLFASLPERWVDKAYGKDGDNRGIKQWAKGFLDTMVPGSMPPLFAAVVEWQANYSFFKQRDVVPSKESDMDERDQYGPDTSTFAKWAGEKTGLSPRKIDNTGQNLFAGAYGGLTNLHDTLLGNKDIKAPWETFKLDPWGSPQSTQDYYDRRKDVKKAHNSFENKGREISDEDKYDYKRTQKVDKKLDKLNKRLRTAQEEHDKDEVRALKREIAEMLDYELDSFEKR